MTEWPIDTREKRCPACDQGPYRSLGQHWARSADCSPPTLDDRRDEFVRGLLLGDASLEGRSTPLLAITSMREQHARWIHDELGWLSRGVEQMEGGAYRVRTVVHPRFGRYLTWSGGDGVPTTGWELTPRAARPWYACDGGFSFTSAGATGQVTFPAATDARQRALERLLGRAGFRALRWDRRVALPRSVTQRWLDWLGEPTPGSEHKWATSKDEYEPLR
ncbi:hypothetical protein [Halosegnis rubeus]|jgi:hypothetical protein|uniref:Uncharacterized protein n=1 Tax=Halosegnis rubeus TaxID=2212850 RepID=A0A5N5UJD2_9EURY|nr:hypothetical protein [Halosegnis rubeus]KAB7518806.1 hypothetical protein DP108_06465 [Halosegnis rubeus]